MLFAESMRFGTFGSDYDHYDDGPDVPDGYIPEGDALEFVFEHQRDAVEEAVRDEAAHWLNTGRQWLDLLNIVSRHDKEQLRETIRKGVTGAHTAESDASSESQLFAVASDAARLLESTGSPYAILCTLNNLTWANDLISLTRAFRELLFLLSESDNSWLVHYHLEKPLAEVNSALAMGRPAELKWGTVQHKDRKFFRRTNPESTPLHSHIAEWICEFMVVHSSSLGLSVCAECGTIFVRERRDNVYCSKACQNRIAYKRKKIFESGALVEEKIDPNAPSGLTRGMWISHPRLGLGRIEAVRFSDRRLWVQFEGHGFGERIPDGKTGEETLAKVREGRKEKPVSWEEVVDPRSIELRVRFLQIARTFRAWELFPHGKKAESIPTFYRVVDPSTLADLL